MKKELSVQLNKYLADVGVAYIKFHNLHWNVVGIQFKNVHEYLESVYDSLSDILDETAEILKMADEIPLGSMKAFLAVSSIQELEDKSYTVLEARTIAAADIAALKATAEAIRKLASEDDYYTVVVMLEDHLVTINKTLWFLQSMLK